MIKLNKGFTIIELLVALAVLAILAAISIPSFSGFIKRQAIKSDAQVISKAFTSARMQAMVIEEGATTLCWTSGSDRNFTVGGGVYKLVAGRYAVFEGPVGGYVAVASEGSLLGDSTIIKENESDDDCVGFNSMGRLINSPVATLSITLCPAATDSTDALRVEVNSGGRVMTRTYDDAKGVTTLTCS